MYHGERFDNRGRWLFVGSVKTIVATTSSADIMRLSLMDHGMGGSPIPPIGFYRSRKIGEVRGEKKVDIHIRPQYAAKVAAKRALVPPGDACPLTESTPVPHEDPHPEPTEDWDPREIQNHPRDFRVCEKCLGYWVKKNNSIRLAMDISPKFDGGDGH